jgi:predicted DNA-binding protein
MCILSRAAEVSMKTQRVTLLVSQEDKQRFKSLAEDRGLSVSEFVRQAVEAYGVNVISIDEARDVAVLTKEIRQVIPAMRKSLRNAVTSTSRAISNIDARRSTR